MTAPSVVSVYGDPMSGEKVEDVVYEGSVDVHVSLAGEHRANGDAGGEEFVCKACQQELVEEWFESSDGRQAGFVLVGRRDDRPGVCDEADDENQPHDVQRVPLSWANSARISMDEEQDRITVAISVGDPRGGFTMTVERIDGKLRLSVPHDSDGMLHRPLTALNGRGYFEIG